MALRCLLALAALVVGATCFAQSQPIRVGVVLDGPTDRPILPVSLLESEAANVLGADAPVIFDADKRWTATWTLESANAALDAALADEEVDVVITLGALGSHGAAHRAQLSKPVIAPVVIDAIVQQFPLQDGRSGRRNFTYIADFQGLEDDVRRFHDSTGFKHVAVLADEALLRAAPELGRRGEEVAASLPARITILTGRDAQSLLAQLPADADAVYVAGLLRFDGAQLRELAQGLSARKLPSFSVVGRSELESGLLMTTGGAERDAARLARRVVLMVQRVAAGEDAGGFEVGFPTEQQLAINMRTADAIGYSPRWQDLADAQQLGVDPAEAHQPLTLVEAMRAALEANPQLAASRARLDSSAADTRIARSNLLPSLDASHTYTTIDADRASSLTQAERSASTGFALQQVIYSERAWAGYSVSRSLLEAAQQGQRQDMLDTLESAASAYLAALRAKAVENVRRSNVDNTRRNFEIARVRENVGLAGRSDLLRWQAQLARDKQELLAAEAARRQAETELARIMHRPASRPFVTVDSGLDDPFALAANPRMRAFLETPARWSAFMEYVIGTALQHAPEIASSESVLESRRRSVTAARRAFFIPDLALVSSGSKAIAESGVGSSAAFNTPNDEAWSVSLQISMPIYSGGRRSAELSQARHELRASEADHHALTDAIEARARASLQRTASSYPSIELAAQAAAAANENLAMVTDAYARGAVSVTDLIDAQDASLSAELGVADARYDFLDDFVSMLRSMSDFEILLDPYSREAWIERVEDWFRDHESEARAALR